VTTIENKYNQLATLPAPKLKAYLNLKHKEILKYIFKQEIGNNERLYLKQKIIQQNITKPYDRVLALMSKDKIQNEFFNYYESIILLLVSHNLDEENFHKELEKINEKTSQQKSNGVYYTPDDVTSFIVYNSIFQYLNNLFNIDSKPSNSFDSYLKKLFLVSSKEELCGIIASISVYDPTCGTGAFLTKVFEIKVNIIQKLCKDYTEGYLYGIISNLSGNDTDAYSTYITKTRILFKCLTTYPKVDIKKIYEKLNDNFTNINFITNFKKIKSQFDIIVGNPPYVERNKLEYSENIKYGNIYADVIHNSLKLIKPKGVLGVIVPISYISTIRMRLIREYVERITSSQFVMSYADRPDCLFSGVHQKLNILFAKKNNNSDHVVYTSDYKYWYKNQRNSLFDKTEFIKSVKISENYYPKLCNNLELKIFNKIIKNSDTIVGLQKINGNYPVYLNKRSCFWTKSFIKKPLKDREYSKYSYCNNYQHVCNCILNSSLFWWFWVKVSDCWHITNKELFDFKIPKIDESLYDKFRELSLKLEKMLEKTKNKINTSQALYEYKHKKCINEINEINDLLARVYHLTEKEMAYIKNYNIFYRVSGQSK